MRRHLGLRIADALAEIERGDQGRDAAGDVDHGAAGEVEAWNVAAVGVEQAAHAPDHVRHGAIDHERPEREKNGHRELNFMRSAKAPQISAGVMMANINW